MIGGGATGLGVALDAASRGLKVLLLEAHDFGKGTSSRSTKLVHGGVRYLAQGNIRLVYGALRERGLLLKNAPHIVSRRSFVIPCYTIWEKAQYLSGLKIYDWLSGRLSLGASRVISKKEVIAALPNIRQQGLVGGVRYFDGQFNDTRLLINLAQTCIDQGATVLNYIPVTGFLKNDRGRIGGVRATDRETGKEYSISAKSVINATGVFVDQVLRMEEHGAAPVVTLSQGIHLVVPKQFLPGEDALMIPKTADDRVLFAVPWEEHVLVGTTDTPVKELLLEPQALEAEVNFILQTVARYMAPAPARSDVLSVFAGLRPLVAGNRKKKTKQLSRDHSIFVSNSGLISVTGGKWTTYRQMGVDVVNQAIGVHRLEARICCTHELKIHGFTNEKNSGHLCVYGSDAPSIVRMMQEDPSMRQEIAAGFPHTAAEVVWAVRHEMARTVEDVLARRLRLLFLDARNAMAAAPVVAAIMRKELHRDAAWEERQVASFNELAKGYLLPN